MLSEVDCGQPPTGVFTVTVSTTNTKFGDTYTYACITNYETGQSLTTTCQADGKWSIGTAGPTCTRKAFLKHTCIDDTFIDKIAKCGSTALYSEGVCVLRPSDSDQRWTCQCHH